MAITAAMVKELREKTGAGMMDCKKALTATEGDAEKAEEIKEEGADKFAKRGLFNAVKRQESEISAQMRQIERDKTLSAAEKRERLSDLEDRRDRLARRAL